MCTRNLISSCVFVRVCCRNHVHRLFCLVRSLPPFAPLLLFTSPSVLHRLPLLPSDRRLPLKTQYSPLVASTQHASCTDRPNSSTVSPPCAGCSPTRLTLLTALASWARFWIPSPFRNCLYYIQIADRFSYLLLTSTLRSRRTSL